jgi:hypothetical protein
MSIIGTGVIINNNSPIGVPPGGTEDQILAKDSNTNFDCKWVNPPAVAPYKVYSALLSQSGTSAPTAIVLQNTLGGNIVWTREGVGVYKGTLAGAFLENKTNIGTPIIETFTNDDYLGPYILHEYSLYRINNNECILSTALNPNGVKVDSQLSGMFIEIRVYP